jgi:hypothetical protein
MGRQDEEDAIKTMEKKQTRFYITTAIVMSILLLALMLLWSPVMRPWTQERTGMANLARSTFDNQIRAEQAAAEREAAVLRAQAIAIVGAVARDYPEYRYQEFIGGFASALENGTIPQVLYVPTENGLPLLPSMEGTN